jgi:hypothetical protein
MDPQGYAVPPGAHIRRMNPRDTAVNAQRRRVLRRGATYGPALPEGTPEDEVERGIAAFVICASLVRQFEFVQNVWVNDPNFHELGNEHDPMIGTQDGTFDFTIPKPYPQEDKGPSRVHDRQGWRLLFSSGNQSASASSRSWQLDMVARRNAVGSSPVFEQAQRLDFLAHKADLSTNWTIVWFWFNNDQIADVKRGLTWVHQLPCSRANA